MLMTNHLAGSLAARGNAHTVNRIVETCFQQFDQVFTGYTLSRRAASSNVLAELLFQQTIRVFCLLLFFQLQAILAQGLRFLLAPC